MLKSTEAVMLLMLVYAAVAERPGEKRAVVSLTDEEATHDVSVFAIFKKVRTCEGKILLD